ncbi:MAG: PEP-utilizing enzyme, partial [Methylocystis sp.]
IEWAKDGLDGKIYIVQARPETVASQQNYNYIEEYKIINHGLLKAEGRAVGGKIVSGKARIIESASELSLFEPGEILIAQTTSPDWGTVMKSAKAIVTDRGGRTCHAAIVARELGIPAVVGTDIATQQIKTGELVSVSCAEGEVGKIYEGKIDFEIEKTNITNLSKPNTHIMMNIGNPDLAFRHSMLPNDGVGLARMEFIIAETIKAHPMALIHPNRLDARDLREIQKLTKNYPDPSNYFIEKLSQGVATIAAAFYPKPVIVRMSDFKTNEYASLIGGKIFEYKEENPMIGFRGASRYSHPSYKEAFALECLAMKKVRNDFGLINVKLMIPFCRRIDEAKQVLQTLETHGLKRGDKGLEIYVMCEIPNNVI